MYDQLTPANLLEETFVFEITGASWRLRPCAAAEGDLADFREEHPFLDEAIDKTSRSIERASAAAHSVINRSLNQLRKLQTDGIVREKCGFGGANDTLAAEVLRLVKAQKADMKTRQSAADREFDQVMAGIMSDAGAPGVAALQQMPDKERTRKAEEQAAASPVEDVPGPLASNCEPAEAELASNCEPAETQSASNCKTVVNCRPHRRDDRRKSPLRLQIGQDQRFCCGKNEPSPWKKVA